MLSRRAAWFLSHIVILEHSINLLDKILAVFAGYYEIRPYQGIASSIPLHSRNQCLGCGCLWRKRQTLPRTLEVESSFESSDDNMRVDFHHCVHVSEDAEMHSAQY